MITREAGGDPTSLYDGLRRRRPELFASGGPGSIELLAEADDEYGVMYEDSYITLIKDPVRFPGGSAGTYIRVVSTAPSSGAAILPVLDNSVVLVRHFRHATREWHWEIPRGNAEPEDESGEETARRELFEELGVRATTILPLGTLHTNTGISGDVADLFLARIQSVGWLQHEEGILEASSITVDALEEMIASNHVTDAFTVSAFCRARLLGLL